MLVEADLHIHSVMSDGLFTPEELLCKGKKLGLKAMAITDHDSIDGISQAMAAGEKLDIKVIPGVELSLDAMDAQGNKTSIHMLGLDFDINNSELQNAMDWCKSSRKQRNLEMIQKFNNLGIPLTLADVQAEQLYPEGNLGRPHFASALVKKGYVPNFGVAMNYLGQGGSAYVHKQRLSLYEGLNLIRQAGGVASWAHSGKNFSKNPGFYKKQLKLLMDSGLNGLEIYHSEHTAQQISVLKNLAKELKLTASGGSDYHGQANQNRRLGVPFVSKKVWEHLLARTPVS